MDASRIANVTVAWLGGPGRARPNAVDVTASLFEDTLWIGSEARDFVSGLASAIVAARGERVVVMPVDAAAAGPELALALMAWPERAVVALADGADRSDEAPFCGIHRRADLLERARAALDEGSSVPSLAAWLAGLEVERVSLDKLGLGDRSPAPSLAREVV